MIENKERKQVSKTWLFGHSSCVLIIPKLIAKEYGIDKTSYIVIEKQPEGTLIKKLLMEA